MSVCKKMAVASGIVTTDEVETAISDSLREIGIERIKDKQKAAVHSGTLNRTG